MTLVLGMGLSGRAASSWLHAQQACHWVYSDQPHNATTPTAPLWRQRDALPPGCSRVIRSPSFPLDHPLCQEARRQGLPLLNEVELGMQALPHITFLGVTGTNGKTTTVELTEHLLRSNGIEALAAGNNGRPVCQIALEGGAPIVILELSSYQLVDLQTQALHAAAFLNWSPDHLDWHGGPEPYAQAKAKIATLLLPGQPLLAGPSALQAAPSLRRHPHMTYGEEAGLHWSGLTLLIGDTPVAEAPSPVGIWPDHDRENLATAAWLAHQCGVSWQAALDVAPSFQKGAHRCEQVARIGGVSWVNDSKATNVDATVQALRSTPGPLLLIAGGVHKGASYEAWAPLLQEKARCVLTIGSSSQVIAASLRDAGYSAVVHVHELQEAVRRAANLAQPGETVLFSPGCSSFDQFMHYQHRGETFRALVHEVLPAGVLS